MTTKTILKIAGVVITLIAILWFSSSLVGYNPAGEICVKESPTGTQSVIATPGMYFKGFSRTTQYHAVMTVDFTKGKSDSNIDIDPVQIRFNDGSTAMAQGIVKINLPKDEASMLTLHFTYRTPENLALTGLKPFVVECLKNSAQLMSSEMHYLGGRSTMSQYFQEQLEDGVYILETKDQMVFDSMTHENKRIYLTDIVRDATGKTKSKKSMLTAYNITISDANISDVDYEEAIDKLLARKIEAQTQTSVSKQKFMQAQQEALTSEAEGKRKLVEIEYEQKQNQTKQLVEAETQVALAERDRQKQKIALEASRLEAAKIKELAQAEAFRKKVILQADGALQQKLDAQIQIAQIWAEAFREAKQPFVPSTVIGGGMQGNAGHGQIPYSMETMMQMMMVDKLNTLGKGQ